MTESLCTALLSAHLFSNVRHQLSGPAGSTALCAPFLQPRRHTRNVYVTSCRHGRRTFTWRASLWAHTFALRHRTQRMQFNADIRSLQGAIPDARTHIVCEKSAVEFEWNYSTVQYKHTCSGRALWMLLSRRALRPPRRAQQETNADASSLCARWALVRCDYFLDQLAHESGLNQIRSR